LIGRVDLCIEAMAIDAGHMVLGEDGGVCVVIERMPRLGGALARVGSRPAAAGTDSSGM
jgi:hypothetical protein